MEAEEKTQSHGRVLKEPNVYKNGILIEQPKKKKKRASLHHNGKYMTSDEFMNSPAPRVRNLSSPLMKSSLKRIPRQHLSSSAKPRSISPARRRKVGFEMKALSWTGRGSKKKVALNTKPKAPVKPKKKEEVLASGAPASSIFSAPGMGSGDLDMYSSESDFSQDDDDSSDSDLDESSDKKSSGPSEPKMFGSHEPKMFGSSRAGSSSPKMFGSSRAGSSSPKMFGSNSSSSSKPNRKILASSYAAKRGPESYGGYGSKSTTKPDQGLDPRKEPKVVGGYGGYGSRNRNGRQNRALSVSSDEEDSYGGYGSKPRKKKGGFTYGGNLDIGNDGSSSSEYDSEEEVTSDSSDEEESDEISNTETNAFKPEPETSNTETDTSMFLIPETRPSAKSWPMIRPSYDNSFISSTSTSPSPFQEDAEPKKRERRDSAEPPSLQSHAEAVAAAKLTPTSSPSQPHRNMDQLNGSPPTSLPQPSTPSPLSTSSIISPPSYSHDNPNSTEDENTPPKQTCTSNSDDFTTPKNSSSSSSPTKSRTSPKNTNFPVRTVHDSLGSDCEELPSLEKMSLAS